MSLSDEKLYVEFNGGLSFTLHGLDLLQFELELLTSSILSSFDLIWVSKIKR